MIGVVGGSGFIGSRLNSRLSDRKKPFKIFDKQVSPFFPDDTIEVDVRDFEALASKVNGISSIINLAAEHRDDVSPKSLYDDVNVKGAKNICSVCDMNGIQRIIFTSSVAVYGFAPKGTDENGEINYFNDYGRTKWEAEEVFRSWFNKDPENRSLTIIRPTVVFGERNRGNVYNLLRQISSGLFPMIGSGENVKSMAYVENVAAFIEYCLKFDRGYRVFNYIDKPDFDMNHLVKHVKHSLDKRASTGLHWPYLLGLFGGYCFDFLAFITRRKYPISSIRIKKFCSDTQFEPSNIKQTEFSPPVTIEDGIANTVKYEFLEERKHEEVLFYSE